MELTNYSAIDIRGQFAIAEPELGGTGTSAEPLNVEPVPVPPGSGSGPVPPSLAPGAAGRFFAKMKLSEFHAIN